MAKCRGYDSYNFLPVIESIISEGQAVYRKVEDEYYICRIKSVNKKSQYYNVEFLGGGKQSPFPKTNIPFEDNNFFYIPKATTETDSAYFKLFGAVIKDALWWYWQPRREVTANDTKGVKTSKENHNRRIERAKAFLGNKELFAIANLNVNYLIIHAKQRIDEGNYYGDDKV